MGSSSPNTGEHKKYLSCHLEILGYPNVLDLSQAIPTGIVEGSPPLKVMPAFILRQNSFMA